MDAPPRAAEKGARPAHVALYRHNVYLTYGLFRQALLVRDTGQSGLKIRPRAGLVLCGSFPVNLLLLLLLCSRERCERARERSDETKERTIQFSRHAGRRLDNAAALALVDLHFLSRPFYGRFSIAYRWEACVSRE